jgi:hypothetical protein
MPYVNLENQTDPETGYVDTSKDYSSQGYDRPERDATTEQQSQQTTGGGGADQISSTGGSTVVTGGKEDMPGAARDTGEGGGGPAERPDREGGGTETATDGSAAPEPAKEMTADEKARAAAETAAMGAQSRAIGAAQASGLSAAAGANAGANAGTQTYSNVYPDLLGQLTGLETQEDIQKMLLEWQKNQAGSNQLGQILQGGAAALPYILSLFSDERMKTGIKDNAGMLDEVARHVRGKSFKYSATPGRDENGIMAQDLEKTPLKSAVMEGPGGAKMVDSRRLTAANTGMIMELNEKLDKAFKYIGRTK